MKNTGKISCSANPIERFLGDRLAEIRLRHDLSPDCVDALAQQPAGTCHDLERGLRFFGATELYALARTFDVDPSWFFDGLPLETSQRGFAPALAGPPDRVQETANLVAAFREIREPGLRKTVLKLVNSIANDPAYAENVISLRQSSGT